MPIAATLLQILAQYGPQVYAGAVAILHHPDPTKDDFLGLLDSIAKEDYDAIIEARRAARGLSSAPAPTPPATDATAARYDTLDAAKAAITATDAHVLQYADGKFGVWPAGFFVPAGATQAYP